VARVLVVDDVPDNIKLLTYELADEGHEVLVAHDGPQALAQADAERPDVILLDIIMPGLDGIEVCRRLKSDPQLRSIPVVMVSARGQEHDVIAGLDAGAQDYVTKPFNLPIVLARVRAAERTKTDHDRQIEKNRALAELATVDALTSARNRRFLEDVLHAGVSFSVRHALPLSLIMLDVDDFKRYNDTFGHPAGDDVLRIVAAVLQGGLREHDIIARYGGEEFAILLPATDGESARSIAERLRASLAGQPWSLRAVTASLGVATMLPDEPIEPAALVAAADRALYHSKARGRNCVTHLREITPSPQVELGSKHGEWPSPHPTPL
jgi:two-component system cell cycle response regulator